MLHAKCRKDPLSNDNDNDNNNDNNNNNNSNNNNEYDLFFLRATQSNTGFDFHCGNCTRELVKTYSYDADDLSRSLPDHYTGHNVINPSVGQPDGTCLML